MIFDRVGLDVFTWIAVIYIRREIDIGIRVDVNIRVRVCTLVI